MGSIEQAAERLLLMSAAATLLLAVDLAVKATIPTAEWQFHERSVAWQALCVGVLAAAVMLARVPSRAVAVGAGVMSGGVAGNLLSARWNDSRVPNPLLLGDSPSWIAFNAADVFILTGIVILMVSLSSVTIRHREALARLRRRGRARLRDRGL